MNNICHKIFLFPSIFLCLGLVSYAQSASVMDNIVHHVYDELVGSENTGLYNGPEFKDQFLDSWDDSHMYLDSSVFMNGTLVYNNQLYTGVPLKYDIYGDNVIIRSNDHLSSFQVELIAENISRFTVHNRDFTKLTGTGSELEGNGYFEVAILGKVASLYIKHVKREKGKQWTISFNIVFSRIIIMCFFIMLHITSYMTLRILNRSFGINTSRSGISKSKTNGYIKPILTVL